MNFDIISIGSATVDFFVYTENELVEISTLKESKKLLAFPLGSKILINEVFEFTGGGGTNTSVGFSRLGLKSGFIGNLGEDLLSKKILDELKQEKVVFLGTNDKKNSTGFSIVLNSFAQDRTILSYKGANDYLDFNKLKLKNITTKAIYLSSLVNQSFDSGISIIKSFKSKNQNILTFFNPSSYLLKKGIAGIRKYVNLIDLLIVNKEEAQMICMISTDITLRELSEDLVKLVKKPVVITNGGQGACFYDGKKYYFKRAHKIKVREKTGAGDAFSVGFVYGILNKKDYSTCLEYGIKNSESVIKSIGAKNVLLSKL